jgi:hypothetical protein
MDQRERESPCWLQGTDRLAVGATQKPLHAHDCLEHAPLNVDPQFGTDTDGTRRGVLAICIQQGIAQRTRVLHRDSSIVACPSGSRRESIHRGLSCCTILEAPIPLRIDGQVAAGAKDTVRCGTIECNDLHAAPYGMNAHGPCTPRLPMIVTIRA